MVRVTVPVVAVGFAVSVSVLVVAVGLGLKAAVTPLGSVEGDRVTLRSEERRGGKVSVLEPLLPWVTVRLLGEAERVWVGAAGMVRLSVVVFERVAELMVMVRVTVPVVAVGFAVSVSVLVVAVGLGLKAAVTPLGSVEGDRVTLQIGRAWCRERVEVAAVLRWVRVRMW